MRHTIFYTFLLAAFLSMAASNDQVVVFGKKFYYVGKDFFGNWYVAWSNCAARGMKLLSLETEGENALLKNYLETQGILDRHYWTSASDGGTYGKYVWLGTGKEVTFTNWRTSSKEPNGDHEHCIRTENNFQWNDVHCRENAYLICERTLEPEEIKSK